jgi:hypothetical protein
LIVSPNLNLTITNSIIQLDSLTPLVGFQNQGDPIYFDLTSTFYLQPHTLLLHKFSAFGLPGGHVTCCHSYLTNRQIRASVSRIFSSILKCSPVVLSGLLWSFFFSGCLFMIYMIQLSTLVAYFADNIKRYYDNKSVTESCVGWGDSELEDSCRSVLVSCCCEKER